MSKPNRFDRKRLRMDHLIKWFFGSNALVSIFVLALITLFLFREGAGFFPQNLANLRLYRLAGLEYVEQMHDQIQAHTILNRSLQELRRRQINALLKAEKSREQANAALAEYDQFSAQFGKSVQELRSVVSSFTETVTAIKEKVKIREDKLQERQFLLNEGKQAEADAVEVASIDFSKELAPVKDAFPQYLKTSLDFRGKIEALLLQPPILPVKELQPRFEQIQRAIRAYLATFPATEQKLKDWNQFAPVPWYDSLISFLFGKQWVTRSSWQEWYGILPLVSGSMLIALIALLIAVPMGVCAAIYVSEFALADNKITYRSCTKVKPRLKILIPVYILFGVIGVLTMRNEKNFIKIFLEFIAAIPSVVIGFFGVAVFGETVRTLSEGSLHWIPFIPWDTQPFVSIEHAFASIMALIPGFPIQERLNAFTAGCLLALMAIPTIFSLSEDALNSVPRSFKEASFALGATRIQTMFRVLVPAALSGIISAVLLGFGRVIGETMVVLLCAGNRIQIPNFTQGLSGIFQPVHTMTGIVAQDLCEGPNGTIHYRALFMVGLILFLLALLINWFAQFVVRRFKNSVG